MTLVTLTTLAARTGADEAAKPDSLVPEFVRSASWVEVRTPHFQIITDAGDGAGLDVGDRLERFSAALGRINPTFSAYPLQPVMVYVFLSQDEFNRYVQPGSESLVAYFLLSNDGSRLVINGSPAGPNRSELVYHEFVHCTLHSRFVAIPPWLDEGLAQYYSTCRLSRTTAEFGAPDMPIVEWMRGKPLIDLGLMFAMSLDAPAYRHDNGLRNQFYAQSYVLTHWLQSGTGDRSERFDRFMLRLRDGKRPLLAFREQFPEEEWDSIVKGLTGYLDEIEFVPTRRVELPPTADPDRFQTRPIDNSEALVRLGELVVAQGAYDRADAHFDAALALDPGLAAAQVRKGLVSDLTARGAAEIWYARALTRAPGDASISLVAARGTLERLREEASASAPTESLRAIAVLADQRFARGAQLDPASFEAMAGPGMVAALSGSVAGEPVTRGLEQATAALPARIDLSIALAIVYARQGRVAEAESVLTTRVVPAAGNATVRAVDSGVWESAFMRVRELAEQGKEPEAKALLDRIGETAADSDVLERAAKMGSALDRASVKR